MKTTLIALIMAVAAPLALGKKHDFDIYFDRFSDTKCTAKIDMHRLHDRRCKEFGRPFHSYKYFPQKHEDHEPKYQSCVVTVYTDKYCEKEPASLGKPTEWYTGMCGAPPNDTMPTFYSASVICDGHRPLRREDSTTLLEQEWTA